MHSNPLWVPQSSDNVSSRLVCDLEGHYCPVAACGPKQNVGGPVISHGIDRSHSVACQNLLNWEWIQTIQGGVTHRVKHILFSKTELTGKLLSFLLMVLCSINVLNTYRCRWGLTCRSGLLICHCRKWPPPCRHTPLQSQKRMVQVQWGAGWCPPGGRSSAGFPGWRESWPPARSPSTLFTEWKPVCQDYVNLCLVIIISFIIVVHLTMHFFFWYISKTDNIVNWATETLGHFILIEVNLRKQVLWSECRS